MGEVLARSLLQQLEADGVKVSLKLRYESDKAISSETLKLLSTSKFRIVQELLEADSPITLGSGSAHTETLMIGPKEAEKMLESNVRNRPMSGKQVERYAKMMKKGKWLLNCDAIGFDTNDDLINGQHRLEAIIRSDTVQPTLVVYGLAPEVFEVADAGKPRSASDVLASHGFKSYTMLASLAKLFHSYRKQGRLFPSVAKWRSENADVLELCQTYPGLTRSATFASNNVHRSQIKGMVEGRLIALLHAIYSAKHPEIESWLISLLTGAKLDHDDALFVLRNKLIADFQATAKLPFSEKLALSVLALNRTARKTPTGTLRWSGKDENFPQPINIIASEVFEHLRLP